MGQVLHGSATTTEAIRRAIQNSEESLLLGPEARRSLPYRSLAEIALHMPDRSAPPTLPTPKGHALRRVLHGFSPDCPMHRA